VVPAAEVDEVRIVAGWMARHEPPTLDLDSHAADAATWVVSATRTGAASLASA
jgi:hypothetical protein